MTHKDGASNNHNNKAASISTNVDTLSTNMNNINISNSKDDVSKGAGRYKQAEIASNKKVSISCAQNVEHCNTDNTGTRGQHDSGSNNNNVYKLTISNDMNETLISDDVLFRDPPSPEECPICMQPMPYFEGVCGIKTTYEPCCGKRICCGCAFVSSLEMKKGNMKQLCAFCRIIHPRDKDIIKRLKKRMKLNDAEAFYILGGYYIDGYLGLPKDVDKVLELWNRSAELGSCRAHYNLAILYMGVLVLEVETDMIKAHHHWKLAAIGGHEKARHNLGIMEELDGNTKQAMKHFMIAARCGFDDSLKRVGEGYKAGHVTKDDYAKILRAYQMSVDEMKSEQRSQSQASNPALGLKRPSLPKPPKFLIE